VNQPLDLSRLAGANAQQSLSAAGSNADSSTAADAGTVQSWLAKVDEAGVGTYLELSKKLPVLLLVGKPGDPAIEGFSKSLEQAIQAAGGRVAGCELDADSNPSLAQALRISSLPALFLLLDGKPSPVADSVVPAQELAELVRQVVTLANQEGYTGKIRVAETTSKPIDPRFDEAAQFISQGNLAASESIFRSILQDRPADRDAKAGLAQVCLLQRLAQPGILNDEDRELLSADQLFAVGDFSAALELLLGAFAGAPADSRQHIRERLVEFFGMIGDAEPLVVSARGRLASMLF
jgi:putative thioredoxin